jgi:hypothetical protein
MLNSQLVRHLTIRLPGPPLITPVTEPLNPPIRGFYLGFYLLTAIRVLIIIAQD